jgi:hypothetical protein
MLAVSAAGFPFLRRVLSQRYDPNREPEEARKERGMQLAISKEEFLKARQAEVGGGPGRQ